MVHFSYAANMGCVLHRYATLCLSAASKVRFEWGSQGNVIRGADTRQFTSQTIPDKCRAHLMRSAVAIAPDRILIGHGLGCELLQMQSKS